MNIVTFCKKYIPFIILISILINTGCLSLMNFQTPEVLDPGEHTIGIGSGVYIAPEDDGDLRIEPLSGDIQWRFGLKKNLDGGLRYRFPLGILGDIKYQFLAEPVLVSGDLGISYWYIPGILIDNPTEHWVSICPTLLVGTEHIYGGIKILYSFNITATSIENEGFFPPGLLLGASIGNRFRINPEVTFFYHDIPEGSYIFPPRFFIVGSLGFQYTF
jgi:hypothetical protein